MSFWGHWNGKFPFIPPSAFPGVPVHVSWPGHCRWLTAPPQHRGICLDTSDSFLQIQGLYLLQASEKQSFPEQSCCNFLEHVLCREASPLHTAADGFVLPMNAMARCGKDTRGALPLGV